MNGKRKSESKKPPIDDQDDRLWLNMQIERRLIGCDREYCIRLIGELDERMRGRLLMKYMISGRTGHVVV